MADQLNIKVGGDTANLKSALAEGYQDIAKFTASVKTASAGLKLDVLGELKTAGASNADHMAARFKAMDVAAYQAGGSLGLVNQKLVNLGQAKAHVTALYGELNKAANRALALGAALTLATVAAAAKMGGSAIVAYGDREAQINALKTVMHSAEAAAKHMTALKNAAQMPGVSTSGALMLSVGLQSAQISAAKVEQGVLGIGKALSQVGKGAESFEPVARALTQMATKPTMQGDEILQLAEVMPNIRTILVETFGTAVPEAIAKMGYTGKDAVEMILATMAKMQGTAGGVKNAIANIGINWLELKIKVGEGLLSGKAGAQLEKMGGDLGKMEEAALSLGKALAPFLDKLMDLANWLSKNDASNAKWIAGLAASAGPTLLLGGGILKLGIGLKSAADIGKMLGLSMGSLTAAAGPWGVAIAAVAGTALLVSGAYFKWRDAANEAAEAEKRLKAAVSVGEEKGYLDPKNRKSNTDPSLPSIVGPAKAGQSIKDAEIAKQRTEAAAAAEASAANDRARANAKALADAESLKNLDTQHLAVLESKLQLIKAQAGSYEQQRDQLNQIQAKQEALISAKLAADTASAKDENAKQTALYEAEAARNKLATDRASFEAEHIDQMKRAADDLKQAEQARLDKVAQSQRAAAEEAKRADDERRRAQEERIAAEKRAIEDQFNAADRWHRSMVGLADAQQRAAEAKGDTAGAARAKAWADQLKGEMLMGNLANEKSASGKQAIMADFMAQKLSEETNKAKADQPSIKSGASGKLDAQRADGQLANAVIGGDQARVADILAQAHGRGAGGGEGGLLAAIRNPNTDGLQRSIASALQQRDRRQQQAMLDGLAGYR